MLLLAWIASWIVLFATGHTYGGAVDLAVGAIVIMLNALAVAGSVVYVAAKALRRK